MINHDYLWAVIFFDYDYSYIILIRIKTSRSLAAARRAPCCSCTTLPSGLRATCRRPVTIPTPPSWDRLRICGVWRWFLEFLNRFGWIWLIWIHSYIYIYIYIVSLDGFYGSKFSLGLYGLELWIMKWWILSGLLWCLWCIPGRSHIPSMFGVFACRQFGEQCWIMLANMRYGGFHREYPNSWMVYNGKSQTKWMVPGFWETSIWMPRNCPLDADSDAARDRKHMNVNHFLWDDVRCFFSIVVSRIYRYWTNTWRYLKHLHNVPNIAYMDYLDLLFKRNNWFEFELMFDNVSNINHQFLVSSPCWIFNSQYFLSKSPHVCWLKLTCDCFIIPDMDSRF